MKTRIHILVQALIIVIMGSDLAWALRFRNVSQNGIWHNEANWQMSVNSVQWQAAGRIPTAADNDIEWILIQRGTVIEVTQDLKVNRLLVEGRLKATASLTVVNGPEETDMLVGSFFNYGYIEHCGNIDIQDGAKVDAWWGNWTNHCTSVNSAAPTNSLSSGSITNRGEIKMGNFTYSGGSVRGNPFLYDPSLNSTATLVLDQAADDTSMAIFWPSTNGPANITVTGNLTLNGTRTIGGTLRLEGSSAVINNLGEILIEGTFERGLGSGSLIGNPLRYGANGALTISNSVNASDVIDDENLFWPATNGPANVNVVGNVTLNTTRTVAGTLVVSIKFYVVGTLITNGTTKVTGTLDITGTHINNGTIQALTGGIEVSGKLTNNGTTQLNFFTLNPGGVVSGNDFVYDKARGGTLIFNSSYNINDSTPLWPRQNGPANVKIPPAISVTVNAARAVSGVLQIDGTLQVADTLTTNGTVGGGTLQVEGTLIANGTTIVRTLIVAGTLINYGTMENYGTYQISGTLTNNGTTTSYGPYEVSGTLINNGTQNLSVCQVSGTLTNNGATHITFTFQLDQGATANGNDFTYNENGTLVFNNASGAYDVNSGSVYWPKTNGPANVILQDTGGITMKVARAVKQFETAAKVTNADSLTITDTVLLNVGGSFDSPPIYTDEATLLYGSNGTYQVSVEWRSGTTIGAGVPMNVVINHDATVNMPSSPRTCPGYLRNSGTLVLNPTPGADLSVGGNWENEGTFEPNLRAVIFNGKTEQSIGFNRRMNMFDYLTINNPAGILVEGQEGGEGGDEEIASVTVEQTLTFAAGNIRLRLADLTLEGPVNGSALNRHVVTYEKGRVVRAIAADSSFQFPIGPTEKSYNPLTITLAPGDTTETFSVRVDSMVASNDSLFVQRTWDIQEKTPGDNHAALTFQWAGAEEGAKFRRNISSTYLDDAEVVSNRVAMGTDPYMVSTTGEFPCTEFALYTVGTPENVTGVEERVNELPTAFMLSQNYPNPFNPSTTISYALPQAVEVELKVYDLTGKEIATLVSGKQLAGKHEVRWSPNGLASGVYVYRLQAKDTSSGSTQKVVLTKKIILLQ